MRVLYLSYDGLTDGLGRSQILPYILGLEERGHGFTIVSFEKRDRFHAGRSAIERLIAGRNIKWIPLRYTPSPPILSTVYDVLRLRKLVKRLHREQPFSVIHCRSYITSLVGLHLKRRECVPFVFDMRAFYADERVDGNLWNLRNPIFKTVYHFFKRMERAFLQEADFTVSLTGKGRDIIHSWTGLKGQPLPIEVIPCCADLNHFSPDRVRPELRDSLMAELGLLKDDLVLTYLGSVGTWYMLPEMLDFFKVLLSGRPNAKLLFITPDSADEILPIVSEKGILQDHIIIRQADREEVPTYLSLAHVALFFIKPVFSKSGSSPTKHGEMLGMGLPLITNANVGDMDRIVSSSGTGIIINDFSEQSYLSAVAQMDDLLLIPKERMYQAAQDFYSLEMGVQRYDAIYRSIADQQLKLSTGRP